MRIGRGTGCPYCAGKAVHKGFNDLYTLNPMLAAQWHPTKNGTLTPYDVTANSGKRVWWICKEGHEWISTVTKRHGSGRGCPVCSGNQVLAGYNDLATTAPLLAEQWNPTKNGTLTPNDITRSSGKVVWWMCPTGHEWQATPAQRNLQATCPNCHTGTSFSEQAIYFYAQQVFIQCYNRYIFQGREIDIYLPDVPVQLSESLSIGIEHDGPFHEQKRIQEFDQRKDALMKRHGIYLIRLKMSNKDEVDKEKSIIYYQYDIDDYNSLEQAIMQMFALITDKTGSEYSVDINVQRDETAIYAQYRIRVRENSLFVKCPEAKDYWYAEKNKNIDPYFLSFGSRKTVWWRCKEGHSWSAATSKFTSGSRCPYCSGKRVLKGFNDLASQVPELAEQWHDANNGSLKPDEVTVRSHKYVWWKCAQGHSWQARISERANGGCPYCSGHRTWKGFNDLATVNPILATEWHPTKNGEMTPADVTGNSNKKVWWLCKNGHEWQAQINSRARGVGCARCSGRRVTKGENDLATTHPKLALEWNPTKNKELTPCDVSQGSDKKVWWLCIEGHEWKTSVSGRVSGTGCPVCSGNQLLKGYNDLVTTHPQIAAQWHTIKNGRVTPSDVTKGTNKKIWWLCDKGHEWLTSVSGRVSGSGCPICAGRQVLVGFNDLASRRPELAAQWHPTENGDLAPADVTANSGKKVWWICDKAHEWKATVDNRTRGGGCPVCAGKKVLQGFNDLATFCPQLIAEWHPSKNGELTPQGVTKGSGQKVWWQCSENHEWQASIANRVKGAGCPYCANKRILPGYNDLCTVRPDLAQQWHPTRNGKLNPNSIGRRSEKRVWWVCGQGHEWLATVENRTRGTGCPFCAIENKRKLSKKNSLL